MGKKKTDSRTGKKIGLERETIKKLTPVGGKDLGQVAGGRYGGGLSRENCLK